MTALISGVIALSALALGIVNLTRSIRNDKRDLFLKVHRELLDPDLIDGRRLLYQLTAPSKRGELLGASDSYTKMNRALAMFDVLALYVDYGWIRRETVLDEWSYSLAKSLEPALVFIRDRDESEDVWSWPHYRALAEAAVERESRTDRS